MGSGGSLCTYGNDVELGNQCVAGAQGPLQCPPPTASLSNKSSLKGQAATTTSCVPDKHFGYYIQQVLWNIIPFVGPSIAAFFPSPSSTTARLQDAQIALADAQCQLKSSVTQQLTELTQNICELEVTLFGTDSSCGYVQLVVAQASFTVYQRAALLAINVAFLSIIVICLILLI